MAGERKGIGGCRRIGMENGTNRSSTHRILVGIVMCPCIRACAATEADHAIILDTIDWPGLRRRMRGTKHTHRNLGVAFCEEQFTGSAVASKADILFAARECDAGTL